VLADGRIEYDLNVRSRELLRGESCLAAHVDDVPLIVEPHQKPPIVELRRVQAISLAYTEKRMSSKTFAQPNGGEVSGNLAPAV